MGFRKGGDPPHRGWILRIDREQNDAALSGTRRRSVHRGTDRHDALPYAWRVDHGDGVAESETSQAESAQRDRGGVELVGAGQPRGIGLPDLLAADGESPELLHCSGACHHHRAGLRFRKRLDDSQTRSEFFRVLGSQATDDLRISGGNRQKGRSELPVSIQKLDMEGSGIQQRRSHDQILDLVVVQVADDRKLRHAEIGSLGRRDGGWIRNARLLDREQPRNLGDRISRYGKHDKQHSSGVLHWMCPFNWIRPAQCAGRSWNSSWFQRCNSNSTGWRD